METSLDRGGKLEDSTVARDRFGYRSGTSATSPHPGSYIYLVNDVNDHPSPAYFSLLVGGTPRLGEEQGEKGVQGLRGHRKHREHGGEDFWQITQWAGVV